MRRCWVAGVFLLCLGGCAFVRGLYETPETGGKSTMQYISDAVKDLPYGGIVEAIIALGGAAVGGGTMHHVHTRKKKPKAPTATPPAAAA